MATWIPVTNAAWRAAATAAEASFVCVTVFNVSNAVRATSA